MMAKVSSFSVSGPALLLFACLMGPHSRIGLGGGRVIALQSPVARIGV